MFFPFHAEQKGKNKVHRNNGIANSFLLSVLCPEVTEYMHRLEYLLEYHVTHTSMRHSSSPQLGSQHCLLCLTKLLEFLGVSVCAAPLFSLFKASTKPVVWGTFCINSTHQHYGGQRSMYIHWNVSS